MGWVGQSVSGVTVYLDALHNVRIATAFGFVAKTSFEEGLGKTIEWYRDGV